MLTHCIKHFRSAPVLLCCMRGKTFPASAWESVSRGPAKTIDLVFQIAKSSIRLWRSMFNLGCAYRCGKRLCGTHKLKCIIMILFCIDDSQPRLVEILNTILFLLYTLDEGVAFVPLEPAKRHDLVVAIRKVVRFGISLGCKIYDA